MKISYPSKYKDLLNEHGEEDGIKQYKKFLRQFSLEKCIIKYGEKEGKIIYDRKLNNIKNSGVSVGKLINKYGKEEGEKRYKEWKENTRQHLTNFIKRYGVIEGKKRYESFKTKSIKNLGKKLNKNKINTNIEYWLDICNGDIDKSIIKLKERQNTSSLESLIKKYGVDNGKLKYIDINKKKAQTLSNYILLYGEIDGAIKWENYKIKLKYVHSKEYYIDKFGNEKGIEKWKEINVKKINYFHNRRSIISDEFCGKLFNKLKNDYKKIYFSENEYMFFIFENDFKIISPDMFIKDINLVIEFYGDYWHRNPLIYENLKDESVYKIWDHDEKRINKIKDKFNCDVIIVWEKDYRNNKTKIVNDILKKIKNKYGNN